MLMAAGIEANNTAKRFLEEDGNIGGVVDNEVIYIYHNKESMKEKENLDLLVHIAQKKICESKDTRAIVEEAGMSVKFIYLFKGGAAIVKIDDCKGVEWK